MNSIKMKFSKIAAFVACVALLSSCDYQKYNKKEQKDLNAANPYVYGVSPDSLPRQMANKYTANPEIETRVNAIRAKLYSGATSAVVKQ
jgi:hypothetical protein